MAIAAEKIKELRDTTGISIMKCKDALTETNGDLAKAVEYLQRKGLKVAEKKKDKATSSGRITSFIQPDGKIGVLLELGCETDFAAKNDEFTTLLNDLSRQVATVGPTIDSPEKLIDQPLLNDNKIKVSDLLKNKIAKLGENIVLKRFTRFELGSTGLIGSYIHGNGKVGVLLELASDSEPVAKNEEFAVLAKDLCLQIAALSAKFVSREHITPENIEKQKEFYRHEMEKDSGKKKPPQIIEKIINGKLEKLFFAENCLLDQSFIKDDKLKISGLLKNKIAQLGGQITVKRFVRFELNG